MGVSFNSWILLNLGRKLGGVHLDGKGPGGSFDSGRWWRIHTDVLNGRVSSVSEDRIRHA